MRMWYHLPVHFKMHSSPFYEDTDDTKSSREKDEEVVKNETDRRLYE
jgi:hypothetical protein